MTMSDVMLPAGYTARPPTMDDARAVYELVAACSMAEHGKIDFTLEEIRSYWEHAVADLATDAWAVFAADGRLVAEADVARRGVGGLWLYANVHPEHLGRGLGTYLLRRAEARQRDWAADAPEGVRVTARQEVAALGGPARALLERDGYVPVRRSWRMLIEMDGPPPAPVWPAGIAVRTLIPGRDERAVYEAAEEAFADHWGHTPRGFEEYARRHFGRDGFDPSLAFLAMDGETIAGVALCRRREGADGVMGWVDSLSVRRPYRRRGIAITLLRQAFGEFQRRGRPIVGLGVDAQNPTGAVRLYEGAGMRPIREWVEYEKELRPGGEPGAQSVEG